MMLRSSLASGFLLLAAAGAWSAESGSALQRDTARCQAGSADACYDAIRWSPRDPALLIGLGDVLARSGRPLDGIRYYRRAATLSPNFPGLSAKINLLEARMSQKRSPRSAGLSVASNRAAARAFTNAEPESQSH